MNSRDTSAEFDALDPAPGGARFGAGPTSDPAGFGFSALGFTSGLFTAGPPSPVPPPLFRRSLLPPRIGIRAPQ